jgi:hypothetical protein
VNKVGGPSFRVGKSQKRHEISKVARDPCDPGETLFLFVQGDVARQDVLKGIDVFLEVRQSLG